MSRSEMPAQVVDALDQVRRMARKFEFWREEDHEAQTYSAARSLTFATEPDEIDGGYTAWIKELPGCVSDGETEAEALENLVEALRGVLAVRILDAPVNHEVQDNAKVTTRQVAFG